MTASNTTSLDPMTNMCWRFLSQSTIKNNKLYIDGGIQVFADFEPGTRNQIPGQNVTEGYNYHLIEIDLSKPWNWRTNLTENVLNKTANLDTNSAPPQVSEGALFQGPPGDERIYLYGGTTSWWAMDFPGFVWPSPPLYTLWSYDTGTGIWDQHDISSASPFRPFAGLAAEAPELGLAFYFNGEIDSGSSSESGYLGDNMKPFLKGMIVIDTKAQTAVNISTDAATGDMPRTRGGAVYIPDIGGSGIVALFGGSYKPVSLIDSSEMMNLAPMNEVMIFDVGAHLRGETEHLWYKQTTSGDVPVPRAHFCTVMVSAPDKSSHNIYVHSGSAGDSELDDTYVLSLPSFVWTQLRNGSSPRWGHNCHIVGDQMLITGGISDTGYGFPCDWQTKGVGVLNLSSLEIGSSFVPENQAPPYVVPSAVLEAIKGPNGTVPLIRPVGGWNDTYLGSVFGDPKAMRKGNLISGGAIGGAVVGSVIGVTLLVLLVTWMVRKRRAAPTTQAVPQPEHKEWTALDRESKPALASESSTESPATTP